MPPLQQPTFFEESRQNSRPYPKTCPNNCRLCTVDYYTLQFYDIILASLVASIGLAAFARADSGKNIYSGAISALVYCTVVENEVSYNG